VPFVFGGESLSILREERIYPHLKIKEVPQIKA
jgi:hypothetical protein